MRKAAYEQNMAVTGQVTEREISNVRGVMCMAQGRAGLGI